MSTEETTQSEVGWIGEVPRRWSVCALTYRYEVQLGKMLDAKRITGDHLAPYLRNTDVQWGGINIDSLPQMDFDADDRLKYQLQTGDILVCEGGEVGRAAVWRSSAECYYQKALHRLRPYDDRDFPPFLVYALRCAVERGAFATSEKSTIAHLPADALRQHRFPFPPLDEQIAIASYLDAETARIDQLIAEKKKLKDLLVELKSATIGDAVLGRIDVVGGEEHGVRGDAEGGNGISGVAAIPSDVQWMGDVPSHWSVMPLRFLMTCLDGIRVPLNATERGTMQGAIPYWGANAVVDYVSRHLIDGPLVLLGEDGAPFFDRSRPVAFAVNEPIWPNNHIHVLRPNKDVDHRFLAYALNIVDYVHYIDGATRDKLTQSNMMRIIVATPPLAEQRDIASYLDAETARIDGLMNHVDQEIALLQEFRSATITDAVLGRIDAREHINN